MRTEERSADQRMLHALHARREAFANRAADLADSDIAVAIRMQAVASGRREPGTRGCFVVTTPLVG